MKPARCLTSTIALVAVAIMASGFVSNMLGFSADDLLAALETRHESSGATVSVAEVESGHELSGQV